MKPQYLLALFSDAFAFQSYLNTFAFKNTVYTDLWDHLQQVSTYKLVLSHMHMQLYSCSF